MHEKGSEPVKALPGPDLEESKDSPGTSPASVSLVKAIDAVDGDSAPFQLPNVTGASANDEIRTPEQRRLVNIVVFKFLASWVGFIILLTGVCLLANLEWSRPRIQDEMSASFHRKVKLGMLSWTLGLNGLAISTDKLSMLDSDGSPFIIAGHSEIGVAFTPLFQKRVIIKYVEFHRPEVFATQIAPGKWNYSDLLVEGPEIRYVQVDDGLLHLRNKITAAQLTASQFQGPFSNTRWKSYDFEKVGLKLIFPRTHQLRQWPFYLTFKMPRQSASGQKYTSDVSLTLLANGTFDSWKEKKCTIEVRANQLNPDDWRPFFNIPPEVTGLFDLEYRGKGIVTGEVTGDLKGKSHNLMVTDRGNVIFSAPEGKCESKLTVNQSQVTWRDTTLYAGGLKIASSGRLTDWKSHDPQYDVKLSADLNDLADLTGSSLWRFLPGLDKGLKKPPDLKGAAVVELQLVGDKTNHQIYTLLKANDIPLSELLARDTKDGAPLLSLFEVEPNAPIKGQIEISPDSKVLLKDVRIPSKGGVLLVKGYIDAKKHEHNVEVSAKDLILDKFDTAQLEPSRSDTAIQGSKAVAGQDILLTGKVDLDAHFTQIGGKQAQIDVKARLKDGTLSTDAKSTLASGLGGNLTFDGAQIKFSGIRGILSNSGKSGRANSIASASTSSDSSVRNSNAGADGASTVAYGSGGTFTLNGSLGVGKNQNCTLNFSGNHVDIGSLVTFTRAAHIPIPEATVDPMFGVAKQLDIGISGKSSAPRITLSISPEDMSYQMEPTTGGASLKALKIIGGTITFADDSLEFKDLLIASPSGKIALTAAFTGKPDKLSPRNVHFKSTGIDITEVQQYVQSKTLPAQSRSIFAKLVSPLSLSSVQGKIYGDLKVEMRKSGGTDTPVVEGILGLNHISGKYGQSGQLVDNLSGIIVASADDLLLQDMTATLGASHVVLHGNIKHFQTAPLWRIQCNGQIRPQDIVRYLPADSVLRNQIDVSTTAPMAVRCTVSGEGEVNKIAFSAQSDRNGHLRWQGQFGEYSQPAGTPLILDGVFTISGRDARKLDVETCHLVMGDAVFEGSGKYQAYSDKSKPPLMEFVVNTPTAVPVPVLMKLTNSEANVSGVEGTVKMSLSAVGTSKKLLLHGDAALVGVSLPGMNIKDLNGRIHTPRWSAAHSTDSGGNDASRSEARVSISSLTIGAFPVRDLDANIVLESSNAEPKISINSGVASVAGGKVTINGTYGTESSKWHMELGLKQLQVDEFVTNLIEHSGEITGLADGKIDLESSGKDLQTSLHNLEGHGDISIYKGSVPKMGQFQGKLTHANLLQQGIFGFNLNNVVQSVLPVKTGNFDEASIAFEVSRGVVLIDRMTFNGNDLRLRAAGSWNIPSNQLTVEVAGNIPRVASSILPGAVGEVSRHFTIQKAVRVVTFRKLENLPSLPILGDIAADDPRAFTFKVGAALDSPDSISHSIQKSFKWLPNKPNASAHPIPGINLEINVKHSVLLRPHFMHMARSGHMT